VHWRLRAGCCRVCTERSGDGALVRCGPHQRCHRCDHACLHHSRCCCGVGVCLRHDVTRLVGRGHSGTARECAGMVAGSIRRNGAVREDGKPEGLRQSMSWLHTYSSLLLGWLLYAVFFTGTLSYFRDEINDWMRPELHAGAQDANRA